ncbi:MAG: helix-turn-helix domain-containing protein [Candidatus Blackburnbacteria bacterium]|nr:helix-turn-helix domain-containing protein [Candidatus Blackburnbacteria bacterium]
MRTVGSLLKNAREEKGLGLSCVAQTTKIKEKFLIALEESYWAALPNLPIAAGFVKSYAQNVGVDTNLALALLRRDFTSVSVSEFKSQEMPVSGRFVWTPKATVAASFLGTLLLVGGYLFRQYYLFVAPPSLSVETKPQGERFLISGKTLPSATVEVNKRPVLLEKDGAFSIVIDREEVGNKIEVKAVSRSGKSTIVEKVAQ